MWQADPEGVKILDVRTPEEWVFTGHAPMATNIPFAFMAYVWDDKNKAFPWSLNPDFVKLVEERFSPQDKILVTCRSGGRGGDGGQHACASPGSRTPTTSSTGWRAAGSTTPTAWFNGMRRKNGWQMSGLPWTYDLDPVQDGAPRARGDRRGSTPATPRTDGPGAMSYGTTSPGTSRKPWPATGAARRAWPARGTRSPAGQAAGAVTFLGKVVALSRARAKPRRLRPVRHRCHPLMGDDRLACSGQARRKGPDDRAFGTTDGGKR